MEGSSVINSVIGNSVGQGSLTRIENCNVTMTDSEIKLIARNGGPAVATIDGITIRFQRQALCRGNLCSIDGGVFTVLTTDLPLAYNAIPPSLDRPLIIQVIAGDVQINCEGNVTVEGRCDTVKVTQGNIHVTGNVGTASVSQGKIEVMGNLTTSAKVSQGNILFTGQRV